VARAPSVTVSQHAAWLVVLLLAAGCSTTAQPPDAAASNATLSLSGYEDAGNASAVERRTFWDRSKSWEDPGNRTARVASRTHAYRNTSGADSVVVYTTPARRYVGEDRIRSLSALALAELATRSVGAPPLGNASGPTYRASLLDDDVTVRTVTDGGETTAHVARVVRDDVIVVVVVAGADRATVERVLGGVTLSRGLGASG